MQRSAALRISTNILLSKGATLALILGLALVSPAGLFAIAQGKQNPTPVPPPNSDEDRSQNETIYDPGRASEDIEVGTFYMHKGDVDAAIGRFEDAVRAQPNLGKARLLLAEAYEKKKDFDAARRCYQDYLKMFPKAPDAERIQKKIEKLAAKAK